MSTTDDETTRLDAIDEDVSTDAAAGVATEPAGDDESDADDGSSVASDKIVVEWPSSTIMLAKSALNEGLLEVLHKYFRKHESRLWQPSMTSSEEMDDELDSADEIVDVQFRKCDVCYRESNTLKNLFGMIDSCVEDAVEAFVERYSYFSLISTKDEYTVLRFSEGDFYAEHCECTGLDDDGDGASRRLCIVVFFTDAPEEGGEIEFAYQDVKIRPSKGDVLIFPACPLHPNSTSKVATLGAGPSNAPRGMIYATNYIM